VAAASPPGPPKLGSLAEVPEVQVELAVASVPEVSLSFACRSLADIGSSVPECSCSRSEHVARQSLD
jgi:hypothetical protein